MTGPPQHNSPLTDYDAIVLAGGRSERLSGRDKAEVIVGGRRLIDRALEAVAGAATTVVVGPPRPVARAVVWAAEKPPGGGPAAALGAGMGCVSAEIVVLLAVDFPLIGAAHVSRLVVELARATPASAPDGVILCDASGRDQPLIGAYQTRKLAMSLESCRPLTGKSIRGALGSLQLRRLTGGDATHDCDTWTDVETAEAIIDAGG